MKARIEASATAAKRSLNAEIVLRLQESLDAHSLVPTSGDVKDMILGLTAVLRDLRTGLADASDEAISQAAGIAMDNLEANAKRDHSAARVLKDIERGSAAAKKKPSR